MKLMISQKELQNDIEEVVYVLQDIIKLSTYHGVTLANALALEIQFCETHSDTSVADFSIEQLGEWDKIIAAAAQQFEQKYWLEKKKS